MSQDGTYTLPGGRPLVPLRTNTHPALLSVCLCANLRDARTSWFAQAFEQELSDEEEMNMQQEDSLLEQVHFSVFSVSLHRGSVRGGRLLRNSG